MSNKNETEKIEDWEKEEWGGWKIVSDMLDHPNEYGIYPTSKCYKELYDFVVAQKQKSRQDFLREIAFEKYTPFGRELEIGWETNYSKGWNDCRSGFLANAKKKFDISI